jgi:predicted regulator of Ras-like GTPase activity (Roadblock/LC7/MglB family)
MTRVPDTSYAKPTLQSPLRAVLERLQHTIAGTKAIVIVGANGVIVEQVTADPTVDMEMFVAEFATLLRIARRTSEDTGVGDLSEHILISDKAVTIARHISADRFLILVSQIQDQLGRARYEIKQAAWELREK